MYAALGLALFFGVMAGSAHAQLAFNDVHNIEGMTFTYSIGTQRDTLTLPVVTNQTAGSSYSYSLTRGGQALDAIAPGLSFNTVTQTVSGTPTAALSEAREFTYVATNTTDTTDTTGAFLFSIDILPSFVYGTTIVNKDGIEDALGVFAAGVEIANVTLPTTNGSSLNFRLLGTNCNDPIEDDVDGLEASDDQSLNMAAILSGTPTTLGSTSVCYRAETLDTGDNDRGAQIKFDIRVVGPYVDPDDLPLPNLSLEHGDDVSRTLPAAVLNPDVNTDYIVGGINSYPLATNFTYSLLDMDGNETQTPVPGMTFDPATRILSGVAVATAEAIKLTYMVTDGNGNVATYSNGMAVPMRNLDFEIQVDNVPATIPEIADQNYPINEVIEALQLPNVNCRGQNACENLTFTYALTGDVPGLSFDRATKMLTGTPTGAGTTTYTYTADHPIDTFDVATNFTVTVTLTAILDVEDQYYPINQPITDLVLPTANCGGQMACVNQNFTYTLTDLSDAPGLVFDPDTQMLTGTPTVAGETTLAYTADHPIDAFDVTTNFTVTVTRTAILDVEDQNYPINQPITDLVLPTADCLGQTACVVNQNFAYTLTGDAPGLVFDPATQMLTGTPTVAGETIFAYTATHRTNRLFSVTANFTVTVTANDTDAINTIILPEMARAMSDSIFGAITNRIEQSQAAAGSASLGGQTNVAGVLATHGEDMLVHGGDLNQLLRGSRFAKTRAPGADDDAASLAIWGSGDYSALAGESGDFDWRGDLRALHVGADVRPSANTVAGLSISRLRTELEYADDDLLGLGEGRHEIDLASVNPYLGWQHGGLDLWAALGFGEGDVTVAPQDGDKVTTDVDLRSIGMGLGGQVWSEGDSDLTLRGEFVRSEISAQSGLAGEAEVEADATRIRVALEAAAEHVLSNGGQFTPSVELGMRHDGGDGATGTGFEFGGAVHYQNRSGHFTAHGRMRALITHGGGQEEWGLAGNIALSPGADGQGLSLSLTPGYGEAQSSAEQLWQHGATDSADRADPDYRAQVEARLGYGVTLNRGGVVTPYSEMTLGGTDSYRIGMRWRTDSRVTLNLLGERRHNTSAAEHALLLKGEARF